MPAARRPDSLFGPNDTEGQCSGPRFPSYRTYTCHTCEASVVICRKCDRRHRHCPTRQCSAPGRAENCRRYRSDSQRKKAGRAAHAAAQARLRERREFAALEEALAIPPPSVALLRPANVAENQHLGGSARPCRAEATTSSAAVRQAPVPPASERVAVAPLRQQEDDSGTQEVTDHLSTVSVISSKLSFFVAEDESQDDTSPGRTQSEGIQICAACKQPCGPSTHVLDGS